MGEDDRLTGQCVKVRRKPALRTKNPMRSARVVSSVMRMTFGGDEARHAPDTMRKTKQYYRKILEETSEATWIRNSSDQVKAQQAAADSRRAPPAQGQPPRLKEVYQSSA